jgi:hypothetical protein
MVLNFPRNRFLAGVSPLLAGVILCCSALPSTAAAGQYEVFEVCKRARPDLRVEEEPVPNQPVPALGVRAEDRCGAGGGLGLIAEGNTFSGGLVWIMTAPANTTIRGLDFERVFKRPWKEGFEWELRQVPPNQNVRTLRSFSTIAGAGDPPEDDFMSEHSPFINAPAIASVLRCTNSLLGTSCGGAGQGIAAGVELKNFDLTLEDRFAPVVNRPSGALVSGRPVRDFQTVSYSAADRGSGIAKAFLVIDDVDQEADFDLNGGRCIEPYVVLVPCRLGVTSSLDLDTTKLSEGFHEVQVASVDAAGNRGESPIAVFLVHNAPTNTELPAISGRVAVGKELDVSAGAWDGDPTAYTFQWLRCSDTVELISECDPIRGATRDEYVVTRADVRTREVVLVKATNPFGSETAFSEATRLVGGANRTPPTLRGVRLSRKAFHAGGAGASGTVLRFVSSEAGKLHIGIAPAHGRGRPVLITRRVRAGRGSAPIGARPLPPGPYRLTVSLTDAAGKKSKPVRLSFVVLAG